MQVTIEQYWKNMDLFVHPIHEYDYLFLLNGEMIYRLVHNTKEDRFYIPSIIKDEWGRNHEIEKPLEKTQLIDVEPRDFEEEITELKDMQFRFNLLFNKERLYK